MTAKIVSKSGPDASSTAGVCGSWVLFVCCVYGRRWVVMHLNETRT